MQALSFSANQGINLVDRHDEDEDIEDLLQANAGDIEIRRFGPEADEKYRRRALVP